MTAIKRNRSVTQDWVHELPFMQQSVLLTAVRGPDGVAKYDASKFLLRWYRRCILVSSFLGRVVANPWENDGGSFLGASIDATYQANWQGAMDDLVGKYLKSVDSIPHHFHLHLMHSIEILGYKHPDPEIRSWWKKVYDRFAHDMHLWPETEEQLDQRLGDTRDGWLARAEPSTIL